MNKLCWLSFVAGALLVLGVQPAMAAANTKQLAITQVPRLHDVKRPALTVQEWISQTPSPTPNSPLPVQITSVKLNPTDTGIEVVLVTSQGESLKPTVIALGKSYIANIPNAVLALPQGQFRQNNPASGISHVSVTQTAANSIRVTVTGAVGVPTIELFDSPDEGLIFAVASSASSTQSQPQTQPEPSAQTDEPIEILVTGEQEETGYSVPNASTATKTDSPLRDIPQSIQVVPQQVIEDRNVRTVTEALETVSGVASGSRSYGGAPIINKIIRGFDQAGSGAINFRDGFPDGDFYVLSPIETVERVEVLKGPASVLFGAGEPGGIVNTVTKKPLSEPYYKIGFEAGNYEFYQPSIDLSGPLNADRTALYRFIASYQGSSDFQGANRGLTTIAPSLSFKLGNQTNLNLYYEYTRLSGYPASGINNAVFLSDGSLTPRDFATYYPSLSQVDTTSQRFGYILNHKFNDNWQIRNNVAVNITRFGEDVSYGQTLIDDRFLGEFDASTAVFERNNYFGQIDLLGKFETGAISHQVLAGFDFNLNSNVGDRINVDTPLPPLDIRNPNYDISKPQYSTRATYSDFDLRRRSYGIYLQDQIALGDNLKFLIGGRYDLISNDAEGDFFTGGDVVTVPTRNDDAFSPRVGLVYQPSEEVSLYASYTRSFFALSGVDNLSLDRDVTFDPTRGTQYEVGIKTDFLDGRLWATLAAYQITRTNVLTPDPIDRLRYIQTGKQRSRGIELDIAGEILPGWNVTAAYAYTDAEVTEDNTFPVGNRLPNVPENQASLWTTYEIQAGDLEGLGFGLGLFYVGARQGDLDNSFEMGDYFRTDAAIYYRRGRFNAAINMRNLFDIDAAAFAYSPTNVERTEPFTIVGSVSWEF